MAHSVLTDSEVEAPLYQRIRRGIRDDIVAGLRLAGERLPSESELAQSYGTTRTTVRQALSQLVFEGLVVRENGRGSFVAERAPIRSAIDSRRCMTFEEQVALSGRTVTYGAYSLSQAVATQTVATRLRLEPGSEVFRMERLRLIEGRPVGVEERFFPREIGLGITGHMLARLSAHRFVCEIIGADVPTIVVSITAEIATAEIAGRLAIAPGAPVIVRDNTLHRADGTPVLCGRSVFCGTVSTDYVLGRPLPG